MKYRKPFTMAIIVVAVLASLLWLLTGGIRSIRSPPPKELTLSDGTKVPEVPGSNGNQWVRPLADGGYALVTFQTKYDDSGRRLYDGSTQKPISRARAAELLNRPDLR